VSYSDDNVASVRAATADAQPPSFTSTTSLHSSIHQFQPVTIDEVITAVRALPDRSCAIDPLPTVHLKAVVNVIAPFLTELFNRSLSNGVVPEVFKAPRTSHRS